VQDSATMSCVPQAAAAPFRRAVSVLASVATGWLLLMAATASVIHFSAMALWIPVRKFQVSYPFVMGGCGAAAAACGQAQSFSLASILTMYTFALIGLTIGLLPSRKLFTTLAHDMADGVPHETYDYPRWYAVFCVASVVVVLLSGFALTR
jgi:hypothetical protein